MDEGKLRAFEAAPQLPAVYPALRATHATTARAVALGGDTDVIAAQARLVGIVLLRRLRSPMPS